MVVCLSDRSPRSKSDERRCKNKPIYNLSLLPHVYANKVTSFSTLYALRSTFYALHPYIHCSFLITLHNHPPNPLFIISGRSRQSPPFRPPMFQHRNHRRPHRHEATASSASKSHIRQRLGADHLQQNQRQESNYPAHAARRPRACLTVRLEQQPHGRGPKHHFQTVQDGVRLEAMPLCEPSCMGACELVTDEDERFNALQSPSS